MPTPTKPTTAAGSASPSTTARGTREIAERLTVRRKDHAPLTAVRVTEGVRLELPDGQGYAYPGWWVITRGPTVIETVSPTVFQTRYEPVPDDLTLDRTTCHWLDDTLGTGTSRSAESLRAAVRRAVALELGGVSLPFTPAQIEVLQHRANKLDLTLEAFLARLVTQFTAEIWNGRL